MSKYSLCCTKAHTHTLVLVRLGLQAAMESADSMTETADSTTNSVIVNQLPLLNMFDILSLLETADGNLQTIAISWGATWPKCPY